RALSPARRSRRTERLVIVDLRGERSLHRTLRSVTRVECPVRSGHSTLRTTPGGSVQSTSGPTVAPRQRKEIDHATRTPTDHWDHADPCPDRPRRVRKQLKG